MKILFAVSNENISKRIVDSYQKKYGESVSYKNVFYFNAIIREIHKDKTYDRIVISEDLEPFSSSNYDVIDKFILERLKQISNEISAQEKYIDIVIICTDRRTRSGIALSKMYEYRIYNALIGQDRRIDNVCKLLNTPRTAEEAREYYKIDSNQKDTNLVDDVSEQEVQNILIHYKRLGKNEDRYTDSFNNIASQYTDKQLKIIIKCLPLNVRAVLEAECPKYQELVTYADETEEERKQKQKLQEQRKIEQIENDRKLKQKVEKEKREAERNAKREELHRQSASSELKQIQESSGIDLLDNRRKEQRMTGNVVIPNSMNIRNERKIYSDKEIEDMSNQNRSPRTVTNEELKNNNSINLVNNTSAENTLPGFDDFEDVAQPVNSVTAENTLPGFDDFEDAAQPVNSVPAENTLPGFDDFEDVAQPVNSVTAENTLPGFDDFEDGTQPVNSVSAENTLPGFDDFEDVAQTVNSVPAESTLPGFDDFGNIEQSSELPNINNEQTQMQIEAVAEQPEVPQQPKRGRGRPRKYPIEPPKPKGKRGRPRKNPLPEEKTQILPGINDFEDIPELERIQQTESSLPNQANQANIESTSNELPGMDDDWNKNPFEETTNIAQPSGTLPGMDDDWNKDPFEETTNVAQPSGTLPGMDDDWNKDPFEETTNVAQPSGTLPGMDDDWNKDPFEETTNVAEPSGTLPGMDDDWNKDPFEKTTNVAKPSETLLGMDDDWNKDPFEETTNVAEPSGTLPGMDDDWNKDPFAETTNVGEPSGTLQGMNENWIQNSSGTTSTDSEDDWNRDPFESDNKPNNSKNLKNDSVESTNSMVSGDLPHIEQSYNNYEVQSFNDQVTPYSPSQERRESIQKIEENKLYSTGSLDTVLTKDKKIVAFVGTSKNGTSFLVNNLACLFSSLGVKTAILDMTQNKNSYYIYTDNNENLRNIAYTSIENLENGIAEGIKVDRNLNIYTAVPNDNKDYSNSEAILSTLVQNESLILIDCDFQTDLGYFANSQEIYLVQSMDILTIQPLTAFLRELKTKGILDEERLRVVINKEVKVKGLSSKAVIGGMSFYIDPAMSFMTDLFNKDKVKACSIPFDENVYSKYIEQTVNCSISISGYNKNFMNSLKILGNMVYPLLSKQTYGNPKNSAEANYGNKFSSEMNNTLNQMKNKY